MVGGRDQCNNERLGPQVMIVIIFHFNQANCDCDKLLLSPGVPY